jgi:hypothetical protein
MIYSIGPDVIERGIFAAKILHDDPAVTSERSDAELVRNQLYARVGRAQLTELLLAVDGETHFSWELLRRAPVAPEELVPVYAALFVAAMGLDMTDVAIMIPGVRLADIRRASRMLEEDRALRRANDAVVEFMLAHPIAKAWGEGFEASSDLMSLDVNRNLWLSRVDPKRRRHAVGTYTHVLDQWGIVYDQPLLLTTRQAGAAIEGAVRQSITRLERLAVDTHGYTDFGMAIAKLLNLDLCPRLYSLRDRHLHLPRRFEVPAAIVGIVQHDVSLEPIREGWDDLLRLAATIDEGWRSATDVLERFGSAARGDRIYRAGHALGQLHRVPVRLLHDTGVSPTPLPDARTRRIRPCPAAPNLHSTATRQTRPTHRGVDRHVRRFDTTHQLRDGLEYAAPATRR